MASINGRGQIPLARLRILETTDLHMQILGYDYFSDQVDQESGLIHLVDSIDTLRSEDQVTTLLFDNGDFVQGNPVADFIAKTGKGKRTHPMIAAMNTMQYDAVTLGNHEFNYGVEFLQDVLADAQFPITCANITHLKGHGLAQPFLILDHDVICDDGVTRQIKIGVTGFVTPQVTDWDKAAISGLIETQDIVAAATSIVPQIKDAGADIIIALCHSGIGAVEHSYRMENAAVPLAAVPGIDIVLTGHTHEVFPGDDIMRSDVIDPEKGTLHGKPTVMAGFYGNKLGVVDLNVGWDGDRWQIRDHKARLQPNAYSLEQSPLQQRLKTHVQDAHNATLDHIRQPIAQTAVPLHSYFSAVMPDYSLDIMSRALVAHTATVLAETEYHDLPILSAASPFRTGGRAGVGHYLDVPPGPFTVRDAAAIYPFNNMLCAVRRNGAQLRDWLERAASLFAQITPGTHDAAILNPYNPIYNSDTIFGLTYTFDLSQPPRYGAGGRMRNATAKRLCNLRYNDKPVADTDVFAVAVNGYRANGGGGFRRAPEADVLYTSNTSARDVMINYLRQKGSINCQARKAWGFVHHPDTSAIFQSAPQAQQHLVDGLSHIGPADDGFHSYRITL